MCKVRALYCDIFENAKLLHAQQWQKTKKPKCVHVFKLVIFLDYSFAFICKICRSVASRPVLVCDWSEAANTVSVMWTRLITFMWLFNLVDSVTVNDPRWRKYILGMLNLFSTTRETRGREGSTHRQFMQTNHGRVVSWCSSWGLPGYEAGPSLCHFLINVTNYK